MGGKTYKMPSNKYFMKKKRVAGPKNDPVWIYLEKEMISNLDKKPYNKKVGNWLRFLKDLKRYYRCENKRAKKTLVKEIGPRWYIEFSLFQREVLQGFRQALHHDQIANIPTRVRQLLSDLGITRKISNSVLINAVIDSTCDPGIFMWELFEAIYKVSPSVLQPKYDLDAMIMMSSFVFIDLKECLQVLEDMTKYKNKPPPMAAKKKRPPLIPDVRRYGEYLQKNHDITLYSNNRSKGPKPRPKPKPLGTKCRFRSDESYTALRIARDFIELRKKRNLKELQKERTCTYKFWEPPSSLRNSDPKKVAYVRKLKLLKKKANVHFKAPFDNLQCEVAGVSFVGDHPQYILANSVALPTGYTIINSGIVSAANGERFTNIQGNWRTTRKERAACNANCDCLEKWEQQAIDYCKKSKCKCMHYYDLHSKGRCREKFFYPPTKNGPYWVDNAKIYELNPVEDFVRDCVKNAIRSDSVTPNLSIPSIPLATISKKKLLKALLADISNSHLLIPHLPQAHLLNNLLEWVRKRVRGKLTPKQEKKYSLLSQRRWLQLKHFDFRANSYYIPFTLKQLKYMTFEHRKQLNKLLEVLLKSFIKRNRLKQVEQARLMWSTTKYDAYPQKAFLDTYFTYMPSRLKDSYLINPYSSANTAKYGAKTCPLAH